MRPALAWMQWPHEDWWFVQYFWLMEGLIAMGLGGAALASLLPGDEEDDDDA